MADDESTHKDVKTWAEALAQFGGDKEKAASTYPTLDPRYQADVKKYGEAKGIEKYSHDVVDPATIPKGEGSWSAAFSLTDPQEGFNEYSQGLADVKKDGTLGGIIGDVGGVLESGGEAAANLGPTLTGGPPVVTNPNAAPAGPTNHKPAATTTAQQQTSAAAQAANQMMQSLAGEYTGMMSSMQPFMSGSAGEQAGAAAGAMGSSIAGGGVQAQNPAYAAQLAGPQNTVAQAMAAGTKDIAQGVSDLGQADAAYMQTAPYQGLLSALQSEGQYKVETGAATPNVTNTPKWAQAAYADVLGATPAGASSTTTPQSQLAAQQAAASSPSSENQSAPGQAGGSA
jgi:hypothetical protein